MGEPSGPEVRQYIKAAQEALCAAADNLRLGHLREAVSRSYYAMFYASSALLLTQGLSSSKHRGVIALFGQHFSKPGLVHSGYHKMLIRAFNLRQSADYDVFAEPDREEVEKQLKEAACFVAEIKRLLTDVLNGLGKERLE